MTDQEWLVCDDVERMLRFVEKTRTLKFSRRLSLLWLVINRTPRRGTFYELMVHVAADEVRCAVPRCCEPSHTAPVGMPGPVAADYLEELGCVDVDLLLHLRSREDHLPYCFAYATTARL